jgi:hypothetical protein
MSLTEGGNRLLVTLPNERSFVQLSGDLRAALDEASRSCYLLIFLPLRPDEAVSAASPSEFGSLLAHAARLISISPGSPIPRVEKPALPSVSGPSGFPDQRATAPRSRGQRLPGASARHWPSLPAAHTGDSQDLATRDRGPDGRRDQLSVS